MANISSPLNSGTISITERGLIASSNTIFTGSFTPISSSNVTIYPYEKDPGIITGYHTPGTQTGSILWINDGTGGDGKIRWDLVLYSTENYITGAIDDNGDGNVTRYYLTSHNTINLPSGNNTYGTANAYIFDIKKYAADATLYKQYTQYTFNNSGLTDHEIKINGFNPQFVSASYDAIIFTVKNTGSYAFIGLSPADFTYTSNTCSFKFRESGRYTAPGISDYSTGSLYNATKYFDGYVLFVSSSVFGSTASLEGGLIKSPISSDVYFTSAYVGGYNNGYFQLSGDQRSHFKPGTVINFGGQLLMVNGSAHDTESIDFLVSPGALILGNKTRVYTMTYPFTGSLYYPPIVTTGVNSYVLGYGNIGYNGSQLILGTYNKDNSQDKFLVIGNGIASSSRNDIFSVSRTTVALSGSLNVTGSMVLSASTTPTAVPGGVYYDGTHFYLGF